MSDESFHHNNNENKNKSKKYKNLFDNGRIIFII